MEKYKVLSVMTDNNKLDYIKFGSGSRAFVIIPGLSLKSVILSANAVVSAYSEFAKHYTCYLFDRPQTMQMGVTVFDIAEETAKAMSALSIAGADLFGTSQGGMIAQLIAARHPELVRKLVLGSSAARIHPAAAETIDTWCCLADSGRVEELCRDFIVRMYTKDFADKYGDMLVKMLSDCTEAELNRFLISAHAMDNLNITGEIKNIKCPVLVLGADNDYVLSADASREIALILGCDIYLYGEPYGHAVYDEAPDYKQRLLDFYSKEGF